MKLPPANYHLLREIILECCKVVEKKEQNKMNLTNLATVIGPNLFHKATKPCLVSSPVGANVTPTSSSQQLAPPPPSSSSGSIPKQSPRDLMATGGLEDIRFVQELFIYLCEAHADILSPDPPFLLDAVRAQDTRRAMSLLSSTMVDPNCVDGATGLSVLNIVADQLSPSSGVIQALVEAGADVNCVGPDGVFFFSFFFFFFFWGGGILRFSLLFSLLPFSSFSSFLSPFPFSYLLHDNSYHQPFEQSVTRLRNEMLCLLSLNWVLILLHQGFSFFLLSFLSFFLS